MFARVKSRPGQIKVGMARCADVDEIDIRSIEHGTMIGEHLRNTELAGGLPCQRFLRIDNGDDRRAGMTTVTGQVRAAGPRARAEYCHAYAV